MLHANCAELELSVEAFAKVNFVDCGCSADTPTPGEFLQFLIICTAFTKLRNMNYIWATTLLPKATFIWQ